jgi:hypothetical protein
MKTTLILYFFLIANCFSQETAEDKQYNQSGAAKLNFIDTIEEAEKLANDDLNSKTPFLFIQVGIAPIVYPTDKEFRKLYGIRYHDLGCVSGDSKITAAYNKVILKYLCSNYKKDWKKKIRKDVIGFREFKKKNGC